ncbi:MAG: response regulator [Monoglobaceae bacterium]
MSMIDVLICDDLDEFRSYMSLVFEKEEDINIVGETASAYECIELAEKTKPDVILLDISLEHGKAGIEAIERIKNVSPESKIIMLTMFENDEYIFEAYSKGAVDYIIKNSDEKELCAAVRSVYNNNISIRPNIADRIRKEFQELYTNRKSLLFMMTRFTELSRSELEIVKLLCDGYSYKDIAYQRCVEKETIKNQARSIRKKLNYSNTREMITDLNNMNIFKSLHDFDK